jgi:hypothetical protein
MSTSTDAGTLMCMHAAYTLRMCLHACMRSKAASSMTACMQNTPVLPCGILLLVLQLRSYNIYVATTYMLYIQTEPTRPECNIHACLYCCALLQDSTSAAVHSSTPLRVPVYEGCLAPWHD